MTLLKFALCGLAGALMGVGLTTLADKAFGISEKVAASRQLEAEYRAKVDDLEMRLDILVEELKNEDKNRGFDWQHL
jgi:hypothetical protein